MRRVRVVRDVGTERARYERYERYDRCVVDERCGLGCTTRLRHERLRRGYGLRELARALAINETHLSRVERGIEGLSDRRKVQVASLFGLSVEDLFFRDRSDWNDGASRAPGTSRAPGRDCNDRKVTPATTCERF